MAISDSDRISDHLEDYPVQRVGVMGGMFDPVHKGHMAVALEALRALSLDQLRLVPCHLPNHRSVAEGAAADRVAMLQLAAQVDARLLVDERECKRPGVSYTVDTLESLRADLPQASLVLVMGADAFAGLSRWHRWQQIPRLAHIAVVSRPGAGREVPAEISPVLGQCQVASPEQLFEAREGRMIMLTELQLEVSSTQVRELLRGDSADSPSAAALLPAAVIEYINAHGLYRVNESGTQQRISTV